MRVVELLALVLLMIQIDYCSLTEPSEKSYLVVEPTQPLRLARQSKRKIERLGLLSQPTSSHIVQLDNPLDLSAGFLLLRVGLDANQ